jgi:hypothetical protein
MPRNRFAVLLSATIVVALAALSIHASVLRAMGNALVAADALTPVDVIVVAADTFEAGALDAADLVAQHVAPRVAVFTIAPRGGTRQDGNQAVRKISRTDWMVSFLGARGIPVIRIPTAVSGTTDSVPVLLDWAIAHDVRSALLVTAPDHSRRLRHVVERERTSRGVTILVRPTRYSQFNADRWWQSRDGLSTFGKEFPKLVADAALHPWSYMF